MDTELNNPKIGSNNSPRNDSSRKRPTVKRRPKDYSGSRWAGLILLIITVIVSLVFYLRSGAADFFSALFSPAKYTIQK